mgnify:CR=1 FL=1
MFAQEENGPEVPYGSVRQGCQCADRMCGQVVTALGVELRDPAKSAQAALSSPRASSGRSVEVS